VTEVDAIRETLKAQVLERVRWEETVRWFVAAGFETAVELGPGTVLRGLARDIDRTLTVHSISEPEHLDAAVAALVAPPTA
jgi:[acyl-carrier-protein] S-malonyltransferase